MGADDYVTKPFNSRELLARAKNLLRRSLGAPRPANPIRRFGGWHFDVRTRRLTDPAGKRVPLTRAEFELLAALSAKPGEVLSRDRLLDGITHRSWEPHDRTVDVLVRRLRRKIEADPKQPEIIVTAHGEGYVFAIDSSAPR
jgi:two-component system torCAD operon response regulator TorR